MHGIEVRKENIHILQTMSSVYFNRALCAKLDLTNKADWQVDEAGNYIIDL